MTKTKQRNWRHLLIGGLVGLIVLALIVQGMILLCASPDNSNSNKKPTTAGIALEEWLSGSLSPKSFNGTWIDGDRILYRDKVGNLRIHNVTDNYSKIILDAATNSALASSFDHQLSTDKKYVLLALNYQKLYRHTYLAQYKIVNLQTLKETSLSPNDSLGLQLAVWGPKGNSLVYVAGNNIFYRSKAQGSIDHRITNNGVFGSIYNGVPDWVYEVFYYFLEEVFGSNQALWFSPDGDKLAFGYFDDSNTPIMNIPFYGYPGSLTFQYTSSIPIHYPKSGTTNPTVKLFYVDLNQVIHGNTSLIEIPHPPELSSMERILSAVHFPTNDILYATWMNRIQNQANFQLCDVQYSIPNCTTTLSYSESNGWVEQFESPIFNDNGSSFLIILPRKQKDGTDWRHLVMVSHTTATALTSGYFVVVEILSWDRDNAYAYYLATSEQDSAQQHLYRVSSGLSDRVPECLSCTSSRGDQPCLYNTAKFSTDNSHYVLTCAGPQVPEVSIYNANNSSKLFVWEDNKPVDDIISAKSKPKVYRQSVPVPGGFRAQVRLLLPPNADLSGTVKYPMLVYVYGGPDSYQVIDKFNVDWGTYLVTNKSIIYAAIDGRGSGLKGNGMLFAGYRNLGSVEIADQINVTRYLQDKLPYIDRSRTAMWGWSYGGYATGMTLANDYNDVFKCGMSVAPVTDWALYDSIYTERFMGLPTLGDNIRGYKQGQLLNKVDNIKNKKYYLIHGTLDDNVHYQQSLLLAKVLEQKDILFRQQTYTDEDHGIVQTRAHLYHSLENFLNECYGTDSR